MTSAVPLTPESAGAPRPTRSAVATSLRKHLPDIIGVTVVCLVILIGYYQVPFRGRTFSTATYVLGFEGCGSTTGVCVTNNPGDPRPDGGASAWFLEPSAQVIHREIAGGDVPLWTPYEGIGAPLAGNSQTSALDPLMLGVFLHPTEWVTDLSTLLWLFLIGIAAFVAARAIRLSPLAATVVGAAYGLSGWFFADSNLWFFRVYLFLPLIIATIEWTIRSRRRLPPALLGIFLGWMVLVGMPEPMFISVVAACVFAGARVLLGEREGTRRQATLRLLGGGALGVALAAPLLLPFHEYLKLSFNLHPFTNSVQPTDAVHQLVDWMVPRISPTPARAPFTDREWIGAGVVLLAVVAMCHPRALRRYAGGPVAIVAGALGLQIYGGKLSSWTGHIPVWAQIGWTRWGAPVLALPITLLAGIGLQTVLDHGIDRRRLVGGGIALGVVAAGLVATDNRSLDLWHDVPFRGDWPLAIVTVVVIVLAVLMLRSGTAALVIAAVVIFELLLLAPYGIYAKRENPYPSEPWITYLQTHTQDHSRVFSTQGLLYPDVANSYGLSDPRMLDALYPDRYWRYLTTFVSHGLIDRFTAVDPGESVPDIAGNPMFDLLGVRYLVLYDHPGSPPPAGSTLPSGSGTQFRPVYDAGGVKIVENRDAAPRAFVVHDLHTVPNMNGALQFLTNNEPARFPDGSVDVEHFDPRTSAVIEGGAPPAGSQSCATDAGSSTHIVSYSASDVKIAVSNSCAGLLVLSDEYYPGWSATVNGHAANIYPTDVALRGVAVPAGLSTVEFHYRPASFRDGLVLFVIGLIALAFLAVTGLRASRWWRARRGAGESRREDPAEQPPAPPTDSVPQPVLIDDG